VKARALQVLLRKEFLQITRDRLMLRQLMIMPVVQLMILSSAATFEVKTAPMYVVDADRTPASRGVVDRLRASGRFVLAASTPSMSVANDAMLSRKAAIIVNIPNGFERDLVRLRAARMQLVLNAEDGAAAGVTRSYAGQIIDAYAREMSAQRPQQRSPAPVFAVTARGWYNPELNYRNYMIPGILVQLVTLVGTMMTAMNIVREKELGTLDQLGVTPLSRSAFIAGKLLPLWVIAMIQLSLGLLVARFAFHVPMVGSLLLVFLAAAIYLVAALGIGLWISTLVETQQQAMFITFFIVLVYLLMSGLFTPVRSMPEWAQWMAEFNPVKHFIEIMRAVLLKGAGIGEISRQLGILSAFGIVVLSLAIRQHGRRTA